jgi:hypothetical protein
LTYGGTFTHIGGAAITTQVNHSIYTHFDEHFEDKVEVVGLSTGTFNNVPSMEVKVYVPIDNVTAFNVTSFEEKHGLLLSEAPALELAQPASSSRIQATQTVQLVSAQTQVNNVNGTQYSFTITAETSTSSTTTSPHDNPPLPRVQEDEDDSITIIVAVSCAGAFVLLFTLALYCSYGKQTSSPPLRLEANTESQTGKGYHFA